MKAIYEKMLSGYRKITTSGVSGVHFTNILWASFIHTYLKSVKKWWFDCLFVLLEFSSVKAVRKMLMKVTPGLNFINVLCSAFMLADPESVKIYLWFNCIFTLLEFLCVKAVRKMLMKLTPGVRQRYNLKVVGSDLHKFLSHKSMNKSQDEEETVLLCTLILKYNFICFVLN